MALNLTNFAAALKEMYPSDVLKDMTYKNNALLGLLPKNENSGGEHVKVPVIYAPPGGRSATFSTAVTNKGNTSSVAFDLTWVSDYSLASIARRVIMATRSDAHAFARAAKVEVDQAFNNAVRSLAKAVYHDGSGQLGQISSVSSANPMVITLSDTNDITNFEVGMVLVADDTATGASLRTTPATATIDGIDRGAGTITTDFDNSGPTTNWAANDYLFQQGDESAMLDGLLSWLPAAAPTSGDSHFGVDRSVDAVRLAGVRHTGTSQSVEEALLDTASKVGREGGRPDCAFLNNLQYRALIKSLGAKVEYDKTGVTADVYFSGVRIHGGPVPLMVYQDFNCPADIGYILQKDSWMLYSIGPAPHIFDADNDQKMLREASADAVEVRCGYYAQLGCKAPGWNGRTSLST